MESLLSAFFHIFPQPYHPNSPPLKFLKLPNFAHDGSNPRGPFELAVSNSKTRLTDGNYPCYNPLCLPAGRRLVAMSPTSSCPFQLRSSTLQLSKLWSVQPFLRKSF